MNVTLVTKPIASLSANVTITSGPSTILTAVGGGTSSWQPLTGLGCTNCASPIANPTQTTPYCVEVSDNNGCKDTACVMLKVETPCSGIVIADLTVPNAFSPNGDSKTMIFVY